jgi:hypothetical protein
MFSNLDGLTAMTYDDEARRDAARFARRYFAGTVTLDVFLEAVVASPDPMVQALVDAVLHEPQRGGLLGLSDRRWRAEYWLPLERLVAELEKGAAGVIPEERIYPRITVWILLGWALLVLFASLWAAEHFVGLWTALQEAQSFPLWKALGRSFAASVLTMAAFSSWKGWVYRLYLYRTRKISLWGLLP